MHNLSSTPPVYIRKVHQNTSGSAVSELMRYIHHIITYMYMYVVRAVPRAINCACMTLYIPGDKHCHT